MAPWLGPLAFLLGSAVYAVSDPVGKEPAKYAAMDVSCVPARLPAWPLFPLCESSNSGFSLGNQDDAPCHVPCARTFCIHVFSVRYVAAVLISAEVTTAAAKQVVRHTRWRSLEEEYRNSPRHFLNYSGFVLLAQEPVPDWPGST